MREKHSPIHHFVELWQMKLLSWIRLVLGRTAELTTQLGARVFQNHLDGFTTQKNLAMEKAENDFILSFDADEYFIGRASGQYLPDEIIAVDDGSQPDRYPHLPLLRGAVKT